MHHETRRSLYAPPEDQGLACHDIEEARMTLIITDDGVTSWVHDHWPERGELELDRTFVGAACFFLAKLTSTLMMILFLLLTILWRRKKNV